MAATKKERAQEVWSEHEYLKGILDSIPADQRDSVLEHIGEHVLRQDEFSRLSNEAAETKKAADTAAAAAQAKLDETLTYRGTLDKWYAEKVKEFEKAPVVPAEFDPAKYLTKEEAAKLTNEARTRLEAQSLALQEAIDEVKAQHFKTFGEYLTTRELVAHARKIGKPVDAAWQDMVGVRLADKQKADAAAHEADLRAQIEKDVRSKLGPSLVYPTATEPSGTLAGLTPQKDAQFGVKAAMEAIQRGDVKF